MVASNNPNELRLIRLYDAPVADVWDAWTDPEQVGQWWGPRGFTLTTHHKDLRVGGTWRYTMHGPDGVDYENTTHYFVVEPHRKLVYDHGGHEDRPPMFRVTVLFSEIDGQTRMEMTMAFPSPEAASEAKKFIRQVGGEATWDRLAEYLAKSSHGTEKFVINRSFDAPIDLMYDLWTQPEHLSQWLAPTGFTMQFLSVDIRPGGRSFWMMTDNATVKMYGRAEYLELVRPHRIVYTQQFCDERNEKTLRHPKVTEWPATMLTTVTLQEEGPEQTRVTVTWQPHGETTDAELQAFIQAKPGMTLGWTGSFNKLEELLAAKR